MRRLPKITRSSITSLTLLSRLGANDSHGWKQFVEKYGVAIYGWCRRLGLQEHDALDVTQEVLHVVMRKFPKYKHCPDRGGLKNWLFVITKNKINDFWRMRRRREAGAGGSSWQEFLAHLCSPDGSSIASESDRHSQFQELVSRVKSEVSERDWMVFLQAAVHDTPAHVIADDLRVSVNIVYLAKSRVLKRLRDAFQSKREE